MKKEMKKQNSMKAEQNRFIHMKKRLQSNGINIVTELCV